MDLYLQSFRLSVHTFWRYLIVVTLSGVAGLLLIRRTVSADVVWVIMLAPILVIGLLFAFVVLLASLFGTAIVGGVYCALKARGHAVTRSFGHLARLVLIIGLCAFVGYYIMGAFGMIILFVAGSAGGPGDAHALLLGMRGGSPVAHILCLVILTPCAFCLCMGVFPLFSLVHADEDRAWLAQVTLGFGKALRHLMPMAMALGYCGAVVIALGGSGVPFAVDGAGVAVYLVFVWAASWFFSHAVLIWEDTAVHQERDLALAAERMAANRINPRDLRLARERKNPDIA